MKLNVIILSVLCTFCLQINAQQSQNIDFLQNLTYNETLNDVWGYVDQETGKEYAIVGTVLQTSIVDISNEESLEVIASFPGPQTTWRDMKSYENYVYSIKDGAFGPITIIDMDSTINGNPTSYEFFPTQDYEDCHNIYIDEQGFLYISGSNVNDGGIMVYDLKENPTRPDSVVFLPAIYSHDVYARDNKVYTCDIYRGEFSVYDISDRDNIERLGGAQTSGTFTHNAWLSDNSEVLFTTDEVPGGYVDAYSLNESGDYQFLDKYRTNTSENTIPHNVHVHNDYLVTSWYTDGVIILDARVPDRLTKVGEYDTFLGPDGGFSGAWGAYPFLPSGRLLISDRQNGLFVLDPEYVRASHYDVRFENALTGEALDFVQAELVDGNEKDSVESNAFGVLELDRVGDDTVSIRNIDPRFLPKSVNIDMRKGLLLPRVVELMPVDSVTSLEVISTQSDDRTANAFIGVGVVDSNPNAKIEVGQTDNTGTLNGFFPDYSEGEIEYRAVKWGLEGTEITSTDETPDSVKIDMMFNGVYKDDFTHDLGWTSEASRDEIRFLRTRALDTEIQGERVHPNTDTDDYGSFFYSTPVDLENPELTGINAGDTVSLTTPYMYTNQGQASVDEINFQFKLNTFNNSSESLEGPLNVYLYSQSQDQIIDEKSVSIDQSQSWEGFELIFDNVIPIDDSLKISMEFTNKNVEDSHVAFMLDSVSIDFRYIGSTNENSTSEIEFNTYPNPTMNSINVEVLNYNGFIIDRYEIVDVTGGVISSSKEFYGQSIDVSQLTAGTYILKLLSDKGEMIGAEKFVKQ